MGSNPTIPLMFIVPFFLTSYVIEFYIIVLKMKQNLDSIFEINFYLEDSYYNLSAFIEIFPEFLLGISLLYALINVFNDNERQVLQYYR